MSISDANKTQVPGWRMTSRLRPDLGLVLVIVAVYALFVALLGLTRDYLGYGVETDFVGSFAPEAKRLLEGQPLLSTHHPPFYSIALAGVYALVQNWLVSGVLISFVSGIVVLFASYRLFAELCGRDAARGSLLVLLASVPFLEHSIQAATDIFFLALFISSCTVAVVAARQGRGWLYAAAGALLALALFTRTNGISLLLLLLVPFTGAEAWYQRCQHLLQMVAGLGFVAVAFVVFAALTGSDLFPTDNYKLLAAQYFVAEEDKLSGEALIAAGASFDGLMDVLLHDPAVLASTYVSSLYAFLARRIVELAQPPLALLFLPGLIVLIMRHSSWRLAVFALVVLAQFALIMLAPFSDRYYLFLVPVIGAGVGQAVRLMVDQHWTPRVRSTLVALIGMLFIAAGLSAAFLAQARTNGAAREVAEAVRSVRGSIEEDAILVARKGALGFHIDAPTLWWPQVATFDALREALGGAAEQHPLYLFYGAAEKSTRGEFAILANPEHAPPWLHPVAQSDRPGDWVLYRFDVSERPDEAVRSP
jgi:hypothetical protein